MVYIRFVFALLVSVVAALSASALRTLGATAVRSATGATTIQPFGNGTINNTPGQIPPTCQRFGNGMICQ